MRMKLQMRYIYFLCLVHLWGYTSVYAQEKTPPTETDITDIVRKLFKRDSSKIKKEPSTVAFLPSIGYNPSYGFQLGVNITGGRYFGKKDSSILSIFTLLGFATTKGVMMAQARHNLFLSKNTINLQGTQQLSKIVTLDYGAGTGIVKGGRGDFSINGAPLQNDSATFPIEYSYLRFTERVYKRVSKSVYLGVGLSFDIRQHINDEKLSVRGNSPHYEYSIENDYDPERYSANGLLIDVQYNTREHPNRSYGGIYTDVGLRFNQKWMGSTKGSTQVLTEFRKYWSLSKAKPQHVIAVWHWGSYLISGKIPYLELPGTGSDMFARSGRGYTIGAFKGESFFYGELEYRYPITNNGFMSGVVFTNVQTASYKDDKLFEYWQPAAGMGLRFLFNKNTRTNVCLDYAIGRFGSGGIFFGLNEVF